MVLASCELDLSRSFNKGGDGRRYKLGLASYAVRGRGLMSTHCDLRKLMNIL